MELLDSDACDRCLVVAAEEADWVLCEAYAAWGLATENSTDGTGAIFSEGAAAILLGRDGDGPTLERPAESAAFRSIGEARQRLTEMAGTDFELLVSAAGGTRLDGIEADLRPTGERIAPKSSLGEAFAASALMQVVVAALALKDAPTPSRALVPLVGFHGQVAALTLRS
jgi:hypothetical protein